MSAEIGAELRRWFGDSLLFTWEQRVVGRDAPVTTSESPFAALL